MISITFWTKSVDRKGSMSVRLSVCIREHDYSKMERATGMKFSIWLLSQKWRFLSNFGPNPSQDLSDSVSVYLCKNPKNQHRNDVEGWNSVYGLNTKIVNLYQPLDKLRQIEDGLNLIPYSIFSYKVWLFRY